MIRSYVRLFKCSASFKTFENNSFCRFSNVKEVFSDRTITFSNHNLIAKSLISTSALTCISFREFNRHCSQQGAKQDESISDNKHLKDNSQFDAETDHSIQKDNNTDLLFDNIDYENITDGDKESINKFKLLCLEVDVLRQDGMRVPSKLSTDQWKQLFHLQTKSQRRKYLNFLWLNEMKKLSDRKKRERKKLGIEERKEKKLALESENNHITYGFRGNTIFLRVYDTTINALDNNRLIQAMQFGQNVVVDCGFESEMTGMELSLCAKQLTYLFAENRIHKEPFNLHFCNLKKDGDLFNKLYKHIPKIDDPAFPINVTEEDYLNLFPKEKLVYLTPHCRNEMMEFNYDDIYIIGAMIDKVNQAPLSLAKAKSQGLRMAQFPLDHFLQWNVGTKSLTLDQVVKILLDVRTTGDWRFAFRHVPRRKILQPGQSVPDRRTFFNRGTIKQPPRYNLNRGERRYQEKNTKPPS